MGIMSGKMGIQFHLYSSVEEKLASHFFWTFLLVQIFSVDSIV